jgi:hypothetical protein
MVIRTESLFSEIESLLQVLFPIYVDSNSLSPIAQVRISLDVLVKGGSRFQHIRNLCPYFVLYILI